MKKYAPFLYLILLAVLAGCAEAEMPEFPIHLLTTDVPVIHGEGGVTFQARIDQAGPQAIIEQGFVIRRNYVNSNADSECTAEETHVLPAGSDFTLRLDNDWDYTPCTVYAYIKTAGYTCKGKPVTFSPYKGKTPVIHSVTPEKGGRVSRLIIKGEHFSQQTWRNRVRMGSADCKVLRASATELEIEPQFGLTGYYDISISVGYERGLAEKAYFLEGSIAFMVTPKELYGGAIVTIEATEEGVMDYVNVHLNGREPQMIERGPNYLRFICPDDLDGENALLDIYNRSTDDVVYETTVTLLNLWQSYNVHPQYQASTTIMHNNEAYGTIYRTEDDYSYIAELYHYNKTTNLFEVIAEAPENYSPVHLFAKDDYLYMIGSALYNPEPPMYKYQLSTRKWIKCQQSPDFVQFHNSFKGIWLNDAYYVYQYYPFSLYKYTPETDTWVAVKTNLPASYTLLSFNNKAYALDNNNMSGSNLRLYEYNITTLKPENIYFEFPSYIHFTTSAVMCDDNAFYFEGWLSGICCIFRFDMATKELQSLGIPPNCSSFIFPFREDLRVGTYENVYKHTPPI